MKKIILAIAVCILAISLGGCLEDGSYDSVQTTSSIESNFVQSTTTVAEETTTTNGVTTTAETSTTGSTTKTTITTKAKTTTKTTTTATTKTTTTATPVQTTYVLNTNTKKFHRTGCHHVAKIDAENRQDFVGSRQQVINMEYVPCGTCKP